MDKIVHSEDTTYLNRSCTSMAAIIASVAREFGVSQNDILGSCRARRIARPRQVAMYLGHRLACKSSVKVGYALGDRDHSTVLWGCQRVADLASQNPKFAEHIMAAWLNANNKHDTEPSPNDSKQSERAREALGNIESRLGVRPCNLGIAGTGADGG